MIFYSIQIYLTQHQFGFQLFQIFYFLSTLLLFSPHLFPIVNGFVRIFCHKITNQKYNYHSYIFIRITYIIQYKNPSFFCLPKNHAQQPKQKIRNSRNIRLAPAHRQNYYHAQLPDKSYQLIQNQSGICDCYSRDQYIQGFAANSFSRLGLKIQNSQIFFQNTEIKTYMYLGTFPFEHTVYLKHQYCFDNFIKIRYKKITDSPKNSNNTQINKLKNDQGFKQINQPKEANKHRTIGEVVEIVKNWKKLSTQVDNTGHKIHTLTSAAEVIGICKKTLQDYAYQVQFGHEFNFDFEKNINQKIGVLRKFVKNKKKQIAFLNNTDNYWSFDGNSNSDQDLQSGTGR